MRKTRPSGFVGVAIATMATIACSGAKSSEAPGDSGRGRTTANDGGTSTKDGGKEAKTGDGQVSDADATKDASRGGNDGDSGGSRDAGSGSDHSGDAETSHDSATPWDGGVVALASGQDNVTDLVVDSTNVYWSVANKIMKVSINGGTAEVFVSPTGSTSSLAIDSTSVYWIGAPGLMQSPLDGSNGITLAPPTGGPFAIDATDVYFAGNGIQKVPKGGGTVTTLLTATQVYPLTPSYGMAVSAGNVYWASYSVNEGGGGIQWIPVTPVAGGAQIGGFTSGTIYTAITVDSTNVYYTDIVGDVMQMALGGGAITTLAMGPSMSTTETSDPAEGIAVDSTNVYWTTGGTQANNNTDGTVMKVPINGGTATTLASEQSSPFGIAVDATTVYWSTDVSAGSIMKVSKL